MKHLFFDPVLGIVIVVNVVTSQAELSTSLAPVEVPPVWRGRPLLRGPFFEPVDYNIRSIEAEVASVKVSDGSARDRTRIKPNQIGSGLVSCSEAVCQPADRSVTQVERNRRVDSALNS